MTFLEKEETQIPIEEQAFMREFIETHKWKFSKSMPKSPHEYTVKEWTDAEEFDHFARLVDEYSEVAYYWKIPRKYCFFDNYYFWWGINNEGEPILINRAKYPEWAEIKNGKMYCYAIQGK